jgi:hypothetical protein
MDEDQAFKACLDALASLPPRARRRILSYLWDRWAKGEDESEPKPKRKAK